MKFFEFLAEHHFLEWFFVISAFVAYFVVKGIVRIAQTSMRERVRREIAAYVAEGSMTPEQGEKLLLAGTGMSAPDASAYSPDKQAHAAFVGDLGAPAAAARASRAAQRAARRGMCSWGWGW